MGLNTFPCNPYPISTEELNKGNNDDLNARVATLEEEVTDLSSSVAPEFSAEAAYTAGDIVWHEGGLYVFTADHAAGAWSTGDTQAVTVGGELATLSGDVSDLNSGKANQITIAPFFNPEVEYEAGDLVYYNGLTYRCTNDHQGAWDAADFAATTIANEMDTLKSGLTGLTNSISMHNIGFGDYDFDDLTAESSATWFTNWTDSTNFPAIYGSGVLLPGKDPTQKGIIYMLIGDGTARVYTNAYMNGAWGTWKQLQFAS